VCGTTGCGGCGGAIHPIMDRQLLNVQTPSPRHPRPDGAGEVFVSEAYMQPPSLSAPSSGAGVCATVRSTDPPPPSSSFALHTYTLHASTNQPLQTAAIDEIEQQCASINVHNHSMSNTKRGRFLSFHCTTCTCTHNKETSSMAAMLPPLLPVALLLPVS
jgi:hypothetical protein